MAKLPVVSGKTLVRAFQRHGYVINRQRGSHVIMKRTASPYRRVVIPNDPEIAKGTLRQIARDAGLTIAELIEMLAG